MKRYPVSVYIGEPIYFDLKGRRNSKEVYQKISDDIMAKIAALRDKHVGKAG